MNKIIDIIKRSWGMFDKAPKNHRILIGLCVGLIIAGFMVFALSGCGIGKINF